MRAEGTSSFAMTDSVDSPDQLSEGLFEEVCWLVEAGVG
jgi:hypothetical protein